jgi:N-acetylglutamate synthase-like GNAT family acetyltransferase
LSAIRAAEARDVDAIVRIYVDSWNAGFGARMPTIHADASRIERWRHDLSDATPTRWWVAERSARIVGFVGIGPCRDPLDASLGELDTIAVAPVAWRSGVGRALMSVALDELRGDGYRSAVLWTLSGYPRGEAFYVSTGWRRSEAARADGSQVRYDHELRAELPVDPQQLSRVSRWYDTGEESSEMGEVTVTGTVAAPVDKVWAIVRDFGNLAWGGIAGTTLEGRGVGAVRTFASQGLTIRERLETLDELAHTLTYSILEPSPVPWTSHLARIALVPERAGTRVEWGARFKPSGLSDAQVSAILQNIFENGVRNLKRAVEG